MGFIEDLKAGINTDPEQIVDTELEELKGIEIGSCLHEDWRKTRKKDDGTYEPRWKKVKDETFKFVESETCRKNEEGVIEIDIANRSFNELSSDLAI